MTILCHVPVGFPAIAYSPRLPLWYPQLHEALYSRLGFLPLFSEVLPGVLSTRAMPVPPSSRQFQALPCWLWPACSLCSGSPCSGSFQANLHRPVPFLPDCQHTALPHTLRVPHYLFVGSPPLCGISVHHADFLQCVVTARFFQYVYSNASARPPRVFTRSFPFYLPHLPKSDSV